MNTATKTLSLMALVYALSGTAMAQQAVPPSTSAQSEAGEPRAETSSPVAAPAVRPAPASAAQPTGRIPATARTAAAAGQKSASRIDRLELGTATVTGSQEQPKVMYIVPWKRSDVGDRVSKPMNSLVDEILAPVDRDVFKREVVYYHAVQADTSQNGAPLKPAQQGEK